MVTDLKSQLQDSIPRVNIRNHLKILGVFFHLLESVSKDQASEEKALDEFFQRSTYRLQLWVEQIITDDNELCLPLKDHELPPLDVALALHSLMLSPHRYFEDSELRFRQLKRMQAYPLNMMVGALDARNNGYDELKRQPASEYWNKLTGLQFDAVDSMKNDPMCSVICPTCEAVAEVPWKGGHGFAGSHFRHQCSKCQMLMTHDTLRAAKFLQALSQAQRNPGFCLPNTAILIRGELDVQSRCPAIVSEVQKCFEDQDGQLLTVGDVVALAATEHCGIMEYVAKILSQAHLALRTESIPALLRAFDHSSPFTQDIVVALHQQHRFIRTIYEKGWSGSSNDRPSDDDLDVVYTKYADFLQHIVAPDGSEAEWREDILWHTHQLLLEQYRVDIVSYIKVFLNHIPHVEDVNKHAGHGECQALSASILFLKSESVLSY